MRRSVKFAVLLGFLGLLGIIVTEMHRMGAPAVSDMDDYMISEGQFETGANNIVTAVVFDYRGFDTLGEATVLITAVVGVIFVLRRGRE